jgi:hypothetical protein
MIRRNFISEQGAASWLFISQVAHARISGVLTERWHELFPPEVIEAITHHDDGWAKWEGAPQLDPARGRPLSFLEMPVADAISIWSDSISSARRIGPLAGAIVAGHFIGLASGSDHATKPPARDWLHTMAESRAEWIDEWKRASALHTEALATDSQAMLLAADLLSLWLCCDGPVTTQESTSVPNAEMEARAATVLGRYRFSTQSKTVSGSDVDWQGSLTPWPFADESLALAAPAIAVPAAHYTSWAEIAAAARPMQLRWQLRQTLPSAGEYR